MNLAEPMELDAEYVKPTWIELEPGTYLALSHIVAVQQDRTNPEKCMVYTRDGEWFACPSSAADLVSGLANPKGLR